MARCLFVIALLLAVTPAVAQETKTYQEYTLVNGKLTLNNTLEDGETGGNIVRGIRTEVEPSTLLPRRYAVTIWLRKIPKICETETYSHRDIINGSANCRAPATAEDRQMVLRAWFFLGHRHNKHI